jgi:hypothetical protein
VVVISANTMIAKYLDNIEKVHVTMLLLDHHWTSHHTCKCKYKNKNTSGPVFIFGRALALTHTLLYFIFLCEIHPKRSITHKISHSENFYFLAGLALAKKCAEQALMARAGNFKPRQQNCDYLSGANRADMSSRASTYLHVYIENKSLNY